MDWVTGIWNQIVALWLANKVAVGAAALSIAGISVVYTRAYVSAEDADVPACNVFTQRDSMIIRHFWISEIGGRYQRSGSGSPLHPDQAPLWTVLDTTAQRPRCRLIPALEYD